MGVAYYISLDIEDLPFDASVDGKRIAAAEEFLDEIAQAGDMPELMSFFGMDGDELGDILGEDDIPDAGEWHDAAEGATYFERLAKLVAARTDAGDHGDLIQELEEFAAILHKAQGQGARWQLGMDI